MMLGDRGMVVTVSPSWPEPSTAQSGDQIADFEKSGTMSQGTIEINEVSITIKIMLSAPI